MWPGLLGPGNNLVWMLPVPAPQPLNDQPRGHVPVRGRKTPDRGGRQHPPGHQSDRGPQPYPPQRATSPDTATPGPLNNVNAQQRKGGSRCLTARGGSSRILRPELVVVEGLVQAIDGPDLYAVFGPERPRAPIGENAPIQAG